MMQASKTIISYLSFALVLALPPLIAAETGHEVWLMPQFWLLYFLISGLTFFAVVFVLMIQRTNREMYAAAFLGATTFKILACLIFVLIFSRKYHPAKYVFVLDFIYIYFLNTAFEVYALLSNLRNQNLK
jgi:hypothetical protein